MTVDYVIGMVTGFLLAVVVLELVYSRRYRKLHRKEMKDLEDLKGLYRDTEEKLRELGYLP